MYVLYIDVCICMIMIVHLYMKKDRWELLFFMFGCPTLLETLAYKEV